MSNNRAVSEFIRLHADLLQGSDLSDSLREQFRML